jgi:hypothetical protein
MERLTTMGGKIRDSNDFDTVASGYRFLERVLAGALLQKVRCAYLHQLPDHGKILLLGEGPGRFLEELLRQKPGLAVDYLEKSSGMIEQAQGAMRRKQIATPNVSWIHGDILHHKLSGSYDAVACHFFLDCFQKQEIERIVNKVSAAMNPGARWIISDFQLARKGWERVRSKINLWVMYRVFRWVTNLSSEKLNDPGHALVHAGLRLEEATTWNHDFLKSECWTLEGAVKPSA